MSAEKSGRDVVLEIGDRVRAGVSVTHGEKVVMGDAEILPVAATAYGFGGGGDNNGNGGGGGGSWSLPFGAWITRDGKTVFEPNSVVITVASIPLLCVIGRSVVRIIKAVRAR
ncbi:MAG: hypothetical protein FWD83_00400 [Promicromonosporaceae bacterium]|nr:hypothetical protein [Promicromonosporaceae bacterium]